MRGKDNEIESLSLPVRELLADQEELTLEGMILSHLEVLPVKESESESERES